MRVNDSVNDKWKNNRRKLVHRVGGFIRSGGYVTGEKKDCSEEKKGGKEADKRVTTLICRSNDTEE